MDTTNILPFLREFFLSLLPTTIAALFPRGTTRTSELDVGTYDGNRSGNLRHIIIHARDTSNLNTSAWRVSNDVTLETFVGQTDVQFAPDYGELTKYKRWRK